MRNVCDYTHNFTVHALFKYFVNYIEIISRNTQPTPQLQSTSQFVCLEFCFDRFRINYAQHLCDEIIVSVHHRLVVRSHYQVKQRLFYIIIPRYVRSLQLYFGCVLRQICNLLTILQINKKPINNNMKKNECKKWMALSIQSFFHAIISFNLSASRSINFMHFQIITRASMLILHSFTKFVT